MSKQYSYLKPCLPVVFKPKTMTLKERKFLVISVEKLKNEANKNLTSVQPPQCCHENG